ncbi:hypothetical protein AC579_7251 [Pseudocercospora musae]|uniref:Uncharacterized protein n=1 Tax=Pseudocercospora musae TaxID=113226 RepID=A0A139IEY1_9PEZI|nr:hypothetical protein AC579_7251 [Pseudocercospora musae]
MSDLQYFVNLRGEGPTYKRLLEDFVRDIKALLGRDHKAVIEISVHLNAGNGKKVTVWADKKFLKKLDLRNQS